MSSRGVVVATTNPSSRAAKRTRTGCKTCRQRKLKCDEIKPVCGQCRKSNRECQPSEGIAFRHAQNAGFTDGDGTEKDLANFYKYRQKFNNTYFLPVPKELNFVHVTDPYADELNTHHAQREQQQNAMAQSHHMPPPHTTPQYADVAASSLKAMIDPNLEQAAPDSKPDPNVIEGTLYPPTSATDADETEHFHDSIIQALRDEVSNAGMSAPSV